MYPSLLSYFLNCFIAVLDWEMSWSFASIHKERLETKCFWRILHSVLVWMCFRCFAGGTECGGGWSEHGQSVPLLPWKPGVFSFYCLPLLPWKPGVFSFYCLPLLPWKPDVFSFLPSTTSTLKTRCVWFLLSITSTLKTWSFGSPMLKKTQVLFILMNHFHLKTRYFWFLWTTSI